MKHRGLFIVIEGTDGSGKTTQFKLLVKALRRAGKTVATVDYPRYGQPSAYFVEQYLNGKYGTAKQVGPWRGSLFYALDRFAEAAQIKRWLNQGKVVVANRFTWSSAAHQGGKINSKAARQRYWRWLFDLEFKLLGIPKPHLTIVLHMPARVAQGLIGNKPHRRYIKRKGQKDIHEADLAHLRAAERVYLSLAKYSKARLVECVERGRLLTPNEIHSKVWRGVRAQR
jgi:dTMP kinase